MRGWSIAPLDAFVVDSMGLFSAAETTAAGSAAMIILLCLEVVMRLEEVGQGCKEIEVIDVLYLYGCVL